MKKVAFVFSKKAHAASQAFAKSVHAEFYPVSRFSLHKIATLPRHDAYLVESVFALTYPVMKRKLGEKAKIIFRCNSNIFSDEPGRYLNGNIFARRYIKFLLKNIDGIIAVSTLVENDVKKKYQKLFRKTIPTQLVYSFVSQPKRWLKIKPDLKSKNFLFIGYLRHHKGIDTLLKTFEQLQRQDPEIKLLLAGIAKSDLDRYGISLSQNVVPLGFVTDLETYMKQCAYYITTPHYEPGPTASIEAMCAGLIPIVNTHTGHRDHVVQVDKSLILHESEPEQVARRVRKIMKRKDLQQLSDRSRKVALQYTEKKQIKRFQDAFHLLTSGEHA